MRPPGSPAAVLLLLAPVLACGGGAQGRRPSVLVITLDTVRRDAVGFLGRSPSPTPNLDALALESVVFEDAYTVSPVTLPAHTSLFTGLYPATHGVRDNGAMRVPGAASTLAEVLRAEGYRTRAAVAAFVLDECFGLAQGFERYGAPPRRVRSLVVDVPGRRADRMVDLALADLRELAGKDRPFLYWLHLYDPHAPYDAPGTPEDADDRSRYEGEIRFADRELGRLFAGLRGIGAWDELVVVVASDHGEGLDDGRERTHGYFVDDPTMRIPLLIRHPGLAPVRWAAQVSLVDVVPTLLSLLDVPPPAGLDGVDLAGEIRGKAPGATDRLLAIESYLPWVSHGWAPFEGGVRGPLKYVRSRTHELFDRGADGAEETNLYREDDPRVRGFEAELDRLFRDPARRLGREVVELDSSDRERLAALGYFGDGETLLDGGAPDLGALPDTHERYPIAEKLWSLVELLDEERWDEAIVELRTLALLDPGNPQVLERLAELLLRDRESAERNVDEAEELLLETLALRPNRTKVHWILARCASTRAGLARNRMAAAARAGDAQGGRLARAQWRAQTERLIGELRTVLDLEFNHPTALSVLSATLIEEADGAIRDGRIDAARGHLTEAIALLDRFLAPLPAGDPDRGRHARLREAARSKLGGL